MRQIMIIATLGLYLNGGFAFAGGYREAKSIEELMLMNDTELNSEAHSVCLRATVSRQHGMENEAIAATSYLETLVRVARTKHQEEVPQYMKEYRWRAGGSDALKCNEVSMKHVREEADKASKKAGKKQYRTRLLCYTPNV